VWKGMASAMPEPGYAVEALAAEVGTSGAEALFFFGYRHD
jgi:hypothetical protein